jgi:hypothetical protein
MTLLNGVPIDPPPGTRPPEPTPTASADSQAIGGIAGIASLILAFTVPPAGIVVGAIALHQARLGGYRNVLGRIGLIAGIVMTVVVVAFAVLVVWLSAPVFVDLVQFCNEHGSGIFVENGVTYRCNV